MNDASGQASLQQDVEAGQAGAHVTPLDQSLWRKLSASQGFSEAAQSWAPLMYAEVADVAFVGVLTADPDGGRARMVATYPENRLAGGALIAAAEAAMADGRGNVRGAVDGSGTPTGGLVAVATPLMIDGAGRGAVAMEVTPQTQHDLRRAMRQLQWGGAWMRDALRQDAAAEDARRYDHAIQALHAVVGVAEKDGIAAATRAAVTDLAARFDCDRVSLGFRRTFRSHVMAMSHAAQVAKRMQLPRLIAASMDEAIDQRGPVLWPSDGVDPPMATHAHEKLAQAQSVGHIFTVPLFALDRFVGAVTFERPEDRPFTQDEISILEAITTVLAPIVDEKRRNDRWLITKTADVTGAQLRRLLGPNHIKRKLFLVGVIALTAFLATATGPDRVSADARVEGALQRSVAAPFDGFLAESFARAGDLVAEGELLARLDDRDLTLERLGLVTELERARIEFDRALAQADRAASQLQRSRIDQAEAEIQLIDQQLARTDITAPFTGLITSGDLSQSIGSAVTRGEPLFSVAPEGDYRVTLQVDERRIADIAIGQTGALVATALPDESFAIEVTKITPVAVYGEGATTFEVEAQLTGDVSLLQPGMEGVSKVDIGEAHLAMIWTRPLRDWARLWAWRWLRIDV